MDREDDARTPRTQMGYQMRERIAALRSTARTGHLGNTRDGWDDANAEMVEADHRDDGDAYHEAWQQGEEAERERTILEQEEWEVGERLANQYQPTRLPWATRGTSSS